VHVHSYSSVNKTSLQIFRIIAGALRYHPSWVIFRVYANKSSLQGCRNGESCLFSHAMRRRTTSYLPPPQCLPEEDGSSTSPLLDLFPTSSEGCILVFDDSDMHFTSSIANRYPSWRILSTSSSSETLFCDSSLADTRIFWGLNHPYQTIISKAGRENPIPWNEVKCVLWFLNPDSYADTPEKQKTILQNFFEHMAIRLLGDKLYKIRVVLTMNNVRFSLLQVKKKVLLYQHLHCFVHSIHLFVYVFFFCQGWEASQRKLLLPWRVFPTRFRKLWCIPRHINNPEAYASLQTNLLCL